MVTQIYRIPNILHGQEVFTGSAMIRTDVSGQPIAEIFSITDEHLRGFKRNIHNLQQRLAVIPIEKIIKVIKEIPNYYFKAPELLQILQSIADCDDTFLSYSLDKRAHWCKNIDSFAKDLLKYEAEVQHFDKGDLHTCSVLMPKGPVIAILPKNSDEESLYVIVQALLARTPILVRASQWGPSSFSSVELFRSLRKIVMNSGDAELQALVESICIINMFDSDHSELINRLHINNAVYILFGSQETINDITSKIRRAAGIIALGTGLSCAFVMEDADIVLAAKETMEGVVFNKGGECVSTSAVYVHKSVFEKYLQVVSEKYDPIIISEDEYDLHLLTKKPLLILGARFIKEIGSSTAYLKVFADVEDLKSIFKQDLKNNSLDKNITCSIFTTNKRQYMPFALSVPTYNVKFNKGTQHMDMFLPHQGNYIYRELLAIKALES